MAKDYWFKRRRFGYGWIPTTVSGWLVIGVYLIVVVLLSLILSFGGDDPTAKELILFFFSFSIATAALIAVSYLKGPRPKWRWGKSKKDNPEEDF